MTYTQRFFIRGQPFGAAERGLVFIHAEACQPWSIAFFCPQCGDVWAKAEIEGSRYHVYTHPCDKHPSRTPVWINDVPGSILLPLDKDYNDALPLAVLKREFDLIAEHVMRNGE